MDVSNRTVVVTGGGGGIGLALAQAFARERAQVVICGRSAERLADAERELEGTRAVVCDVADASDRDRLLASLGDDEPDILVNNAGIQHNGYRFGDGGENMVLVDEEIDINLRAPVALTELFLPRLLARPEAAIVNVSSALAFVPKESAPIYCATKAALHSFSQALRYQLEGTNVKVFELMPPMVDTAMTAGRGSGKMSPEALANETLRAIKSDRYEIRAGKTRILAMLNRLAPPLAQKIIRKG